MIGPEKIVRIEPEGELAKIDMADWTAAKSDLPAEAERLFHENEVQIERFFRSEAPARERFLASNSM